MQILSVLYIVFTMSYSLAQSTNFCPDCSTWIDPYCRLNRSAVAVSKNVDVPKLQKLLPGEELDPSLNKCVDDTFKLTGNLVGFICFVSPKRGCLVVANQNSLSIPHTTSYVCRNCGLTCGCENIASGSLNTKRYILSRVFAFIVYIL